MRSFTYLILYYSFCFTKQTKPLIRAGFAKYKLVTYRRSISSIESSRVLPVSMPAICLAKATITLY
jgi:hypothetical protein